MPFAAMAGVSVALVEPHRLLIKVLIKVRWRNYDLSTRDPL
jgi:hypothetical protein